MGNQIFGERIKSQRNKKGLTLEALATKLGVSKSRVAMWEANGVVPRQDVLLKLCDFFGVSADYLLGNNSSAQNPISDKIYSIQRGLEKLNPDDLQKAKNILSAAFDKAFNDRGEN